MNTRFENLSFQQFKTLANDPNLSQYEKIGFPDEYRKGKEKAIYADIKTKLSLLNKRAQIIMDIGCGCSELPKMLAKTCAKNMSELHVFDSPEMLSCLHTSEPIIKHSGNFPSQFPELINSYNKRVSCILVYSVIQYIMNEGNLFQFLDTCLSLLKDGGEILIGDIPNVSMRKRFFDSRNGISFHKQFTSSDGLPEVNFNCLEIGNIDDSIIIAILSRARIQGFHAWILPQAQNLPMANRREDILIKKP